MDPRRYVLQIEGCVEPLLLGPFSSAKERDDRAKLERNLHENDGVFWLNVSPDGEPEVGAYSNGFMEGEEGFGGSEE